MIIGEAPGREEELKGKPFVGKAGRELDALLMRSGLKREEVYITNIVSCRPPNNRRPTKKERESCLPRLMEEISSIKPRVIALLGSTAISAFLDAVKVSELHGTFVGHFLSHTIRPWRSMVREKRWQKISESSIWSTEL